MKEKNSATNVDYDPSNTQTSETVVDLIRVQAEMIAESKQLIRDILTNRYDNDMSALKEKACLVLREMNKCSLTKLK